MSQYTEEEQIALIKDWWQRNGKPLLVGAVLALALVFGWQTWQKQQTNQAQHLSTLYQQLLETAFNQAEANLAEVAKLTKSLEDLKPSHAYTQYAHLIVARLAVDEERLDDAAAALRKVVDKPANTTLAELAQQRLARVLAAQDQAEQALKLLEGKGVAAYQSARNELRGDILLQLGREQEARAAYVQAKETLSENAPSSVLTLKLDNLAQKDA